MSKQFSKRAFLTGLLGFASTPLFANAPKVSARPVLRPLSVRRQAGGSIEAVIAAAQLRGEASVAVADPATGQLLEGHQAAKKLPPASVSKAITALYALETLGSAFQFETRLIASGPVENGVLNGDLILMGGGDPSLDTDDLDGLAKALATAGVKSVTGRFLIYGGALPYVESIDGGQPVHVGYSPAISGMCLNYNRVFFEWTPQGGGIAATLDARSERLRPPVKNIGLKLADRAAPIYRFAGRGGRDEWSVARGALTSKGGRWLPVRQPEIYAGEVFRWLAARHGISLPGGVKTTSRPAGLVIASHKSAPLIELLRGMLRYSTNVTAEMIGLTASKARGRHVPSLRASGGEMARWAAQSLGMKGVKFVDHSGLGDRSEMPAAEMAKALAVAQSKARLEPILREIVLSDAQGRPNKSHPIKVRAKTGTLNFVSGLAGYMRGPDGQDLAFAIFSADEATRQKLMRDERERPPGARSWNRRARNLQQDLIERWGKIYAS